MAGISSLGTGSGLDLTSLVQNLVAAERATLQQRIVREETSVTTRISALGTLKGALSSFMGSVAALKDTDKFVVNSAASADTDIFTVTADSTAAAGHYDVEVVRLAASHQLSSSPIVGGSATAIGHGTLTLALGSESFTVDIAESDNTLADIRDAINRSTHNPGISATLINGVDGTRLVLSSSKSGADHAIEVTASGGDGGLNQLTYDPGGVMNLTQLQPAQNSLIRASGIDIESATNVVDKAIDGVVITLKKESAGATVGMDVSMDASGVAAKVQKFVTDYNALQGQFNKLRAYNPETQAKGAMLGDSLLRGIESQVRRVITDAVPGASAEYFALTAVGIKSNLDGTLEVDTAKLSAAIADDPNAVGRLFGATDGVATRLHKMVEGMLSSTGDIETRNKSLSDSMDRINDDKEAMELRIAKIQQRYTKQFTALDTLLNQMQGTSNYLAQQLASLPKMGR